MLQHKYNINNIIVYNITKITLIVIRLTELHMYKKEKNVVQ